MRAAFLGRGKAQGHSPSNSLTANGNPEDIDEVDSEGQNILLGIISQLTSGSDLSRITLPTFILERKSMLERITNQLQHPELLLAAHDRPDPVQRFLGVVQWYLSGWHITPRAVKKPLNPVLGEHFACWWDLPNGTRAYYVAEQTSHHPPKSSYLYMSPDNHIRVDGTLVPRSKFLGNSVASMMEGVGFVKFLDIKDSQGHTETYELTQPNMYARGVLIGTMRYELGDHSYVRCPQNDLMADIEFKTKGFIGGTYHAVHGEIRKASTGAVLYEIDGKWNERFDIRNVATGQTELLFDASATKPLPPQVRPLDQQGPTESRNLWQHVIRGLSARDHRVATDEKSKVEDHQRRLAKDREEKGIAHEPKLFMPVPESKLQFVLYKAIDDDEPPEVQTEKLLSVVPFLPGQEFAADFDEPASVKAEADAKKA